MVSANSNSVASKFGYNGVENEEALGLDLMEMDFRQYDPAIARFTSIDPVTHHSKSTYNSFDNNPVFWADPSGADAIHGDGWSHYTGVDAQNWFREFQSQFGGGEDDEDDSESKDNSQPKYQFYGVGPTGEKMNLNFGQKDFKILTGYGMDVDDIQSAKLSAYWGLFKALDTKNQVAILRFLKVNPKSWLKIISAVGKIGPGSILPAYNVHDEGLAALPFGLGAIFQPMNDKANSDMRSIQNELKWDNVLNSFDNMMSTDSLNDVIIIYSNENLFRQKSINTSEAESLSTRHATGNYKYAYYGTQFGGNLHIFGMYFINND